MVSAKETITQWWERSLDLLFPPCCVHCGRVGAELCTICQDDHIFPLTVVPQTVADIDGFVAAAQHVGAVQSAIHALKYENLPRIAPTLAALLAPHIPTQWSIDIIIPVPLHYERFQERGYNQANLIAQALTPYVGVTASDDLLQRARATRSQVGLTAIERRENVVDAFTTQRTVPPTVLLIDDVCTTGSTLSAAANALRNAGANYIFAATVSQAIQQQGANDAN